MKKERALLTLEASFQKWETLLQSKGIELGSETSRLLSHFLKELKVWNRRTNLISIRSDEDLLVNHLVDSLFPLDAASLPADNSLRCIDVGSGGGFPGIPLRIARPAWSFSFLESLRKKSGFLEVIAERFPLKNCMVLHGRAETWAHDPAHRDQYDAAFCRALGPLATCLEITLPFLKTGGILLAHRGVDAEKEAQAARAVAAQLGGEIKELFPYRLPTLDNTRYIVRVEKKQTTPPEYPRRIGVPAKRPL